jgi:hypothetical protein
MGFQKEDWEFTDQELLNKMIDLLVSYQADPFNCRRKTDYDLQHLLVHVGDRCRMIMEIKNAAANSV